MNALGDVFKHFKVGSIFHDIQLSKLQVAISCVLVNI